jgi:F0F1-type ATP synthase, subunit a
MAEHTAMMVYISIALAIFSFFFARKLELIPGSLQGIAEVVYEFFADLVVETMGEKGRRYFPFIATIAVFIFFSNAAGMIPGLLPPTANLNTTLGLAIIVFFMTHIIGVKEHGLKYFKHFMGPVWWLAPLMIPIEVIGHFARPVSLSLRLFGNMMGHEQIVAVLLILMPIAYPLLAISTLLGVVVVFIQSFIFALLSMMYFGAALEEAH